MYPQRITLHCETCGQPFSIQPYRLKTARFCSGSCRAKAPKPKRQFDAEKRFWSKVRKTESCWLWTGKTYGIGYGHFSPPDGPRGAHRFSWELHHGPIPEGLCVLHNCPGGDNPSCVNPAHLWLGTDAENCIDRCRKGRSRYASGESHCRAVLTEDDVRSIRRRYAAGGISQRALAAEYGCSRGPIEAILKRRTWKHL